MKHFLRNAVVIIAAGFLPLMSAASGCGGTGAGEASQAAAKSADVPTAELAGINVLRGATPEAEQHHDLSAPLTLIPPAPRASGIAEHPVKPIPRHFNRAPTTDPVLQSAAVTFALLMDGSTVEIRRPRGKTRTRCARCRPRCRRRTPTCGSSA